MPLDPSIPLQIQQQPNPFQQIQQPIQTAQGLLALKQNQMQLGANQAISQAYSQSINPDGSVDFNKLQSMAAQNGAGAFLPQFMGQIAQQRNQQLQYDTGKLDLALKQQQSLRGMIGSLSLDPELGKSDMSAKIAGQISDAVQNGLLPIDRGVQEMRSIPSDPQAQASWIQNHLINSLSGEAKIQALMPKQLTVNRGGETDVLNVSPLSGQLSVAGQLSNTLTPGEAAQRIQAVGPNGTPGTIPLGSTVPGAMGGYTGRYDGGGGAPGGFVATGLSPAEQASATAGASTQATQSATAAQTLHNAASDAPMRINLLENARDALSGINTGPGSDWRNQAKSFLNALAPDTAKAIGYTGDVQNYDEFKKILTNYASSVSGSLGTGTDARLNAAVTGNANPNISKLANEDILAKTIAAEKMRAAQDYAWQNSGNSPDKFNQWQSQWNKAVNPDAFVFASMNPEQQQSFLKRQSPQQLAKFKSDLGNLVRAGALQMPGQ
ncbi:hypothetical protein C7410_115172 [Paraburkholderia silvatlantica]|uniref:Uncharacterized protein n=1 Tax=Paraburkholderia silvatlantica TaxID=321895 RepID=A0A2V4T721_9BURK|nr:hypothetical protein [Paraburkholderia silvatlantica]PYE21329.1 hypothetical protein C7410_115172 [Paraburkholderia silvatlantica]